MHLPYHQRHKHTTHSSFFVVKIKNKKHSKQSTTYENVICILIINYFMLNLSNSRLIQVDKSHVTHEHECLLAVKVIQ